jgi:hypothetical protein
MKGTSTASSFSDGRDTAWRPARESACREACLVADEGESSSVGTSHQGHGIALQLHAASPSQPAGFKQAPRVTEGWSEFEWTAPPAGYWLVRPTKAEGGPSDLGAERDTSLSELIDRFENLPGFSHGRRLAARLRDLLEIAREEQPEQAPPAAESLETFLDFLARHRGLSYPDVVLTPEGNARATWRRGRNQRLALEFLDDGDLRFVIFAPDPRHTYKTIRAAGAATIDSVLELAEPYGAVDWLYEAANRSAA